MDFSSNAEIGNSQLIKWESLRSITDGVRLLLGKTSSALHSYWSAKKFRILAGHRRGTRSLFLLLSANLTDQINNVSSPIAQQIAMLMRPLFNPVLEIVVIVRSCLSCLVFDGICFKASSGMNPLRFLGRAALIKSCLTANPILLFGYRRNPDYRCSYCQSGACCWMVSSGLIVGTRRPQLGVEFRCFQF